MSCSLAQPTRSDLVPQINHTGAGLITTSKIHAMGKGGTTQ